MPRTLCARGTVTSCDPPLGRFYKRLGFHGVDEIDVLHPEAGAMRVLRMERDLTSSDRPSA